MTRTYDLAYVAAPPLGRRTGILSLALAIGIYGGLIGAAVAGPCMISLVGVDGGHFTTTLCVLFWAVAARAGVFLVAPAGVALAAASLWRARRAEAAPLLALLMHVAAVAALGVDVVQGREALSLKPVESAAALVGVNRSLASSPAPSRGAAARTTPARPGTAPAHAFVAAP